MSVRHVERALGAEGRTLSLEGPLPDLDVNEFVARGMPGLPDPFEDPVEQRLAGFGARSEGGAELVVRPAPRRATGPDLSALFVGAMSRVGRIEHAWLRARSRRAAPARRLVSRIDARPPVTSDESTAFDAVVREIERKT